MEPVIDIEEFLSLSAAIQYQISGTPTNWGAIIDQTLPHRLSPEDEDLVADVLEYLRAAYGEARRRLGPAAVLHPIRVMALLCRVCDEPVRGEMLVALLHDKLEDISSHHHTVQGWEQLQARYRALLGRLSPAEASFVEETVEVHTRRHGERYYTYLGRLLEYACAAPQVSRIKLADRLDNTLDLRIDLWDRTVGVDAFELIFEALFTNRRSAPLPDARHPARGRLTGAQRLYQLYKNVLFLSLIRQHGLDAADPGSRRLFGTLAGASLEESTRILVHLFTFHLRDAATHREVLMDVMRYSHEGRLDRLTRADGGHPLDGLFERLDCPSRYQLKRLLAALYEDKRVMAQIAVAFAAIFSRFLDDPDYRIQGIAAGGLAAPD